ncbi:T9SS type A sorting domain-containing protein [uncultured Pontibacter sp.]|uniref:T9SS type A sorting domain-containing protein n=1 Tax=uncultured Pontibacter sp. TaxID=453356 RepID=UPI002601E0A3|nr:T9SS type A sorting domain-containing protein [uncultured Pontibacter sp.]
MKQTYALALALGLPLITLSPTTSTAQTTPLPHQQKEHILVSADQPEGNRETLSGIYMTPTKKGTFQLDFSQQLNENALLQVKDSAGKLVYQKPVNVETKRNAWRYQLGKLKPDTYLVEVRTSDTTYWTKFKVGR